MPEGSEFLELTYQTFLLAFGLGLLGFIEPCTIGAHILFLDGQLARSPNKRLVSVGSFIVGRIVIMGGIGVGIVFVGSGFISVQTGFWAIFGGLYLVLGITMLTGLDRYLRKNIGIGPDRWKFSEKPVLQGLVFGLNIPACAAPIMFALIGAAALTGTAASGAILMATFALGLSLPLLPLSLYPRLSVHLEHLSGWLRQRRWVLGAVFVLLGLWSIWFGLYVNPEEWSGQ